MAIHRSVTHYVFETKKEIKTKATSAYAVQQIKRGKKNIKRKKERSVEEDDGCVSNLFVVISTTHMYIRIYVRFL